MSDIEILLREIIDKVDNLEKKVDRIEKQVIPPVFDVKFDQPKILPQTSIWDDIKFNRPAELAEIKSTENFPHQITEDEYKEDGRYAKIEIIYYEVDGVFATLDDKLVEYLDEEYFGIDNLNSFNVCDIYLRDESIHVDYHMFYEGCTSYFAEHKGE